MSDDDNSMSILSRALEEHKTGDSGEEPADEHENISSDEEAPESSVDKPKNISSDEDGDEDESDVSTTPDNQTAESSSSPRSSSVDSSSPSSGRRASSRSRRGDSRSGSSSRHIKAFMFSPEEEHRFNRLLADVQSYIQQEYSEASVQNSHLVRAMIEMTVEDLEQGEDLILDYVLDQIEKDRQTS